MKSLFKIFLFCPIPENQKPIDQYITLKENLFYNWIFLNENEYKKYIFFGTIFLNLFFFLFLNFHYSFEIFKFSLLFTITIVLLILFQWKQLELRIIESRINYEENSWYNTQIWEKPLLLIKNDRLIASQLFEPFLNRLKKTIVNLLIFYFLIEFFL